MDLVVIGRTQKCLDDTEETRSQCRMRVMHPHVFWTRDLLGNRCFMVVSFTAQMMMSSVFSCNGVFPDLRNGT